MNESKASAFQRVVRLTGDLNYSMKRISPIELEVTIPGGLHYDAFHKSDNKPCLGSMLSLMESTRLFALHASAKSESCQKTFIDLYRAKQNAFIFVATAKVEFSESMYQPFSAKYPIIVTHSLDYLGKTSDCVTSVMECPRNNGQSQVMTMSIQCIRVDPVKGKSIPFPDWMKETYGGYVKSGSSLIMNPLPKPEKVNVLRLSVRYADTDFHKHTNWTRYARFCHDACMHGVIEDQYANVNMDIAKNGMESFEITLKSKSVIGDDLEVLSWDGQEDGTINFEIRKGENTCCYATMSFYLKSYL